MLVSVTVREADVGGSEKSRLCGPEKSRLVLVSVTVREADVGGSEKSRLCVSEKNGLVMVSVMVREADRVADHSNRVLLRNGSNQSLRSMALGDEHATCVRPDTMA